MNIPDGETPYHMTMRLTWVDNRSIKLCSTEGVVKVVDIENNFNVINSCTLSLFNEVDQIDLNGEYHMFLSRGYRS